MNVAGKTEMARLHSLYENEKAQLANITGGIKVTDFAIFEVSHQAKLKAQHMALTKLVAGKWSTILPKAWCDKEAVKHKWKIL